MPGISVVALRQLLNTPPDLTFPDLSHQEGDVPSFDDSNGFMFRNEKCMKLFILWGLFSTTLIDRTLET